MLSLDELGPRIVVCGPSNSGKSTLTRAISRSRDLPAIHLDQLRFYPDTDWVLRPHEDFETAHDQAITGDRWVIEGNYSATIARRLLRATGIILLGSDRWSALFRYVRRTLLESGRAGHLAGGKDSLKLELIRFILVEQPQKREHIRRTLHGSGLPMVEVPSMRALRRLYADWDLRQIVPTT